jgi:hypothetical protein
MAIFTKCASQTNCEHDSNAPYIDKHIHSKYDKIQIIKEIQNKDHPYKFQYTNTIFRECMKTECHKFSATLQVLISLSSLKY